MEGEEMMSLPKWHFCSGLQLYLESDVDLRGAFIPFSFI